MRALAGIAVRIYRPRVDEEVMAYLARSRARYVVALTKADKLSRNEQARADLATREVLDRHGLAAEVVLTSAKTGLGRKEMWALLSAALGVPADQTPSVPAATPEA